MRFKTPGLRQKRVGNKLRETRLPVLREFPGWNLQMGNPGKARKTLCAEQTKMSPGHKGSQSSQDSA